MRFGPVPVREAEGGLLAHALKLPGGKLRKGHVLSDADVAALEAAGYANITVARLEPGDMPENEAALALARAIHDGAAGLRLSTPFTGRVNFLAEGPGVVLLEPAKINAANSVDPMITVATVPALRQVHEGSMVATVKVIAYAVPGRAVTRAAEAARAAIRLAPPVYRTASLVVTEIASGPGLKGVEAIEARVTGLGMRLEETLCVPHEEVALRGALEAARGEIVLILTGSATSDPDDIAPRAVRAAGGRLERFGMPVDPGNLLFLGKLGVRPVIGLPGSARSPVLHGADWVLARVACGLEVTSAEIAAMGVGGLLKEIPTRPQPRQRKPGA
ncbi:MAG: molybdopterin-binding protein [Roseovarius sp.]